MEFDLSGNPLAAHVAELEQPLVDDARRQYEVWRAARAAEVVGGAATMTTLEQAQTDQE